MNPSPIAVCERCGAQPLSRSPAASATSWSGSSTRTRMTSSLTSVLRAIARRTTGDASALNRRARGGSRPPVQATYARTSGSGVKHKPFDGVGRERPLEGRVRRPCRRIRPRAIAVQDRVDDLVGDALGDTGAVELSRQSRLDEPAEARGKGCLRVGGQLQTKPILQSSVSEGIHPTRSTSGGVSGLRAAAIRTSVSSWAGESTRIATFGPCAAHSATVDLPPPTRPMRVVARRDAEPGTSA